MHLDIRRKNGVWRRAAEVAYAVWDVVEGRDGNMVAATWGGLCLIAGSKVRYLRKEDGLVCTEVYRVFRDRQGNLWIGALRGVSRYDGSTFLNFTAENGLAGDNVESFFEDRAGRVWIGTSRGVSCCEQNTLRNISLDHEGPRCRVYSVCEDALGLFWIATADGIFTFNGIRFSKIRERGFSRKESHAVFCDSRGTLWLSWPHRGVFTYADGQLRACHAGKRPIRLVNDIIEDRQGNIWFGTWEGAFCYDGKQVTGFSSMDAPGSLQPNRIYQDSASRIWFPSGFSGLLMYDPYSMTKLSSDNTSSGVLVRCRQSEGFWWCNAGSLVHYENDVCTEAAGFDSGIASFLEDGAGRLWVVTARQRLYRSAASGTLDQPGFLDVTDEIQIPAGARIESLAEDGRGRTWIGHSRGMLCFDGGQYEPAAWIDGSGNKVKYSARMIYWDRDNVCWISDGEGQGLIRYDGENFCRLTAGDGLLHNQVGRTLKDSRGRLWVATVMGVSHYDGQRFASYPMDGELITGMVNHIMEDHRGHIWFATTNGVARFDGTEFQHLVDVDGLPCNVTTGVAEDKDGSVLIGTDQGVCRYVPDDVTRPGIVIEEVEAGGRFPAPREVRVTAGTMSVRIVFNGACLRTNRMRYRYRLEGYDNGWTSSWANDAWYVSLPEGQYTFQVTAVNRDLISSEKPAECRLIVEKDLRDQKIDALEKTSELQEERARIARDLHDNLGSGLAEIGVTGDLVLNSTTLEDLPRQYVSDIVSTTREMAEALDEIVWAANPTHDTVSSLVGYCVRYARRIMGKLPVSLRLVVEKNPPQTPLNTGVRHHLFLAFREAVTNVVRHAGAAEVCLTIAVRDDILVISIQDNGRGMDLSMENREGNGLSNMRHRLEQVGGRCSIVSVPEEGTTVQFEMRLPPGES